MNYQEDSDGEIGVPIWVHQNIIKLSKRVGVAFNECRKLCLFMKIDSKRQTSIKETKRQMGENIKFKEMQKLKGLTIDMNFEPGGKEK